jgi:microcystin-dependent protein
MRPKLQNGFKTTLAREVNPNDLRFKVASLGNLTSPCYLVFEPEDDRQREVVLCDGVFDVGSQEFVTRVITNRYLPGSAQGSNITHQIGAEVWCAVVSGNFDAVWEEIAALAHSATGSLSADVHTQYAALDGSRPFTGTIAAEDPIASSDLATSDYVAVAMAGALPVGTIGMYGAAVPPSGWLVCNGQAIPQQYAALKALVGNNVPDFRGRLPLGFDATYPMLATGGSLAHAHTQPNHQHTIGIHSHTAATHTHTNPNTGSNGAHAHTQNGSNSTGGHSHSGPSHTHGDGTLSMGSWGNSSVGSEHSSSGTEGLYSYADLYKYQTDSSSHTHTDGSFFVVTLEAAVSGSSSSNSISGHRHPPTGFAPNHNHGASTVTGSTASSGTGSTSTAANHSHTNPTTADSTTHTHTIGSTGSASSTVSNSTGLELTALDGDEVTGPTTVPYLALHWVIKAA